MFAPSMAARLPFELSSGLVSSTLPAGVVSSTTLPRRGSISGTSSGSEPVSGELTQSSGVCSGGGLVSAVGRSGSQSTRTVSFITTEP